MQEQPNKSRMPRSPSLEAHLKNYTQESQWIVWRMLRPTSKMRTRKCHWGGRGCVGETDMRGWICWDRLLAFSTHPVTWQNLHGFHAGPTAMTDLLTRPSQDAGIARVVVPRCKQYRQSGALSAPLDRNDSNIGWVEG